MIRIGLAAIAGIAWMVTLPPAADAQHRLAESWASVPFTITALVAAGLWWRHMKERGPRIGLGGSMAGWLFVASLALLGVSGSIWPLVGVALVASAVAYGVILLVTQSRAARPRLDLAAGLALFAAGGGAAIFALTTGLGQVDAWWLPAHWILAIGIGIGTIASGLPSGEVHPDSAPASPAAP